MEQDKPISEYLEEHYDKDLIECIEKENWEEPLEQQEKISNIEFNEEFKKSYELMENTRENILNTGPAGSGKSTLLKEFAKNTKKNIVICSPTGISALTVGGQTIHSFFRFPPKIIVDSDIERVHNNSIYKEMDALIIDEISMVRADLIDGIDLFMRMNGKDPTRPFGGVQVIPFGDLFQLPPVVDTSMGLTLDSIYDSPYFFDSKVMNNLDFKLKIIDLTKIYRQEDPKFVEFLNKVRIGEVNETDLDYINTRVNPNPSDDYTTLTTTNFIANTINHKRLALIPGKIHIYEAKIEGNFNKELKNPPVDIALKLKEGAKVIFCKNDCKGRWVNGTIGVVEECGKDYVKVKIKGSNTVYVSPIDWEKVKYEYDRSSKKIISKVIGKFTQIPLKLAWAMTIHKSQSQTLDRIHINISSGVWETGQTYVALSRCRTLEGISLDSKIKLSDIKVDPRITEFMKYIKEE